MLWKKFNLFTFKNICNIILSITKKTVQRKSVIALRSVITPNYGIWKFGIVDDDSSSALNCQFVLVLL